MGTRKPAKILRQNPFAALLTTLKPEVDARLKGFLDAKLDALHQHGAEVRAVVQAMTSLCLRGGKRLRPALVVTGHQSATSSDNWDALLDAGVALELLQAYFLIHDDWMDEDDTRRGGPSVHAHLGKRFRSSHLGNAGAILAGDYSLALATEVVGRLDVPAKRLASIVACFSQMQADAVIGQQLDVVGKNTDIETMYRLKTASYTLQGPLVLGALVGGAKEETLEALARFSIPVGVAFQLRDDLLNAFSPPEVTGKPFAGDLKSGKRTLVVDWARRHGKAADKRALKAAFGNPNASINQLRAAVSALESSGARDKVEQRISALVADALEQLSQAPLRRDGRVLLEGAAAALTDRSR